MTTFFVIFTFVLLAAMYLAIERAKAKARPPIDKDDSKICMTACEAIITSRNSNSKIAYCRGTVENLHNLCEESDTHHDIGSMTDYIKYKDNGKIEEEWHVRMMPPSGRA